jgi:hypothetical protein
MVETPYEDGLVRVHNFWPNMRKCDCPVSIQHPSELGGRKCFWQKNFFDVRNAPEGSGKVWNGDWFQWIILEWGCVGG